MSTASPDTTQAQAGPSKLPASTRPTMVAKPQTKTKTQTQTHCLPPASWSGKSSAEDAQLALHQLIAHKCKDAGFSSTSSSALHELSHLTERFISSLFSSANYAAELSNRHAPSSRDLLYALETHGLSINELRQSLPSSSPSPKAIEKAPSTSDFSWLDPTASFLPSDSEGESDTWSVSSEEEVDYAHRRAAIQARVERRKQRLERTEAKRKRREEKMASQTNMDYPALGFAEAAWHRMADHVVPPHLPGRPPRHSWMATAAYPPNAYSAEGPGASPLLLVNRKLANARLVESSLRRLIQNTDSAAAVALAGAGAGAGTLAVAEPEGARMSIAADDSSPRSGTPADSSPIASGDAATFATPRPPARMSTTLRLKSKAGAGMGTGTLTPGLSTPLSLSRRATLVGGESVPQSPCTPIATPVTPYPPTPAAMSAGQYFGTWAANMARSATELPAEVEMQMRIPGAVNYKNVWYDAAAAKRSGAKRMRRWKV